MSNDKLKQKILNKLEGKKEKVWIVFQRFREDNEDLNSYGFDDDKGADIIDVFETKEKATNFLEELFQDYNAERPEHPKKTNRAYWEQDFNTFIRGFEVK